MELLLIIESNYMMRLFLSNYFSKSFDVRAVDSPKEALAFLKENEQPKAVISDFQDTKSAERNSCEELIGNLNQKNIPAIILTDYDKSEQRIDALALGSNDVISKPFNPIELELRLKTAIGFPLLKKQVA